MKLAQQKLSKYYANVTTTTMGMFGSSADILDSFRKLQTDMKGVKGLDINSEKKTSYTTQYKEAFLKNAENDCCAKHRHVPVNEAKSIASNNLVPCATASGSSHSSFDPDD